MVSNVTIADNPVSTHPTPRSARDTSKRVWSNTKRTWSFPSRSHAQSTKYAEFAMTRWCRRTLLVNSASGSCPRATTATASPAYDAGAKSVSSTARPSELVQSAGSRPTLSVPVATGWTTRRRRTSLSAATRWPSVRNHVATTAVARGSVLLETSASTCTPDQMAPLSTSGRREGSRVLSRAALFDPQRR